MSEHKFITNLPHYIFLENKLAEGKASNKHRPVNERKSRYIISLTQFPELGISAKQRSRTEH